jgi:hypothetical protein
MFSIEEAKSVHMYATYNIPVGVRREWGSEAIIRELEAEATAVHHARMGKLRNAVMELYQRIMGSVPKSAPNPRIDSDAALGSGN